MNADAHGVFLSFNVFSTGPRPMNGAHPYLTFVFPPQLSLPVNALAVIPKDVPH